MKNLGVMLESALFSYVWLVKEKCWQILKW